MKPTERHGGQSCRALTESGGSTLNRSSSARGPDLGLPDIECASVAPCELYSSSGLKNADLRTSPAAQANFPRGFDRRCTCESRGWRACARHDVGKPGHDVGKPSVVLLTDYCVTHSTHTSWPATRSVRGKSRTLRPLVLVTGPPPSPAQPLISDPRQRPHIRQPGQIDHHVSGQPGQQRGAILGCDMPDDRDLAR